jgi:FkbM family methyltransferase
MNSYSQAGQDLWVLKMLNNKAGGFFLDIGAFDGIKYSNSYILEKKFNWNGLLVEPHPGNFESLKKNRTSTIAPYAISDIEGVILFENNYGTGSKITDENGFEVQCLTFQKLFEKYEVPKIIDYMSLDIEGHEYKSLTKFPFHEYKCRTITVEHNLYMGDSSNKENINQILINNGYTLAVENVSHDNLIFEDWYINTKLQT